MLSPREQELIPKFPIVENKCNDYCSPILTCNYHSESHLRQMRLFAENPDQHIDEFSQEFQRGFVEMLSYRHGTKRIQANRAYQEYIGDKNHVHMNATIWTCLTDLCKYLGKEGIATVDETEKGWFIQYIDKDPRLLAKQLASEQSKKVEVCENLL
jgi:DNA/RNA-binding protein KIN17